jgi:protein-S-isoprenylcysteine O-methyltransferase Ste14
MGAFTGPPPTGASGEKAEPPEIIPEEDRKAVMTSLDPMEAKWALWALIVATLTGIGFSAYKIVANPLTKVHGKEVAVSPDAALIGAVLVVLCAIGFLALWKRKRTLLAFDLLLVGFALTSFIQLFGFLFIILAGWLMLRAWRINKYGTTNSKMIAKEAAARPRGRQRKEATRSTSKNSSTPAVRKPPTASKRYTPKAPARKKIPKATE